MDWVERLVLGGALLCIVGVCVLTWKVAATAVEIDKRVAEHVAFIRKRCDDTCGPMVVIKCEEHVVECISEDSETTKKRYFK